MRISLVAALRSPQHPALPAALLPHHPRHHCQHNGQVQCHSARGEFAGQSSRVPVIQFEHCELVLGSAIINCCVRSRAQLLPSSCQPFCCGRCRCSCPSSSTTPPSSNPTGPGTNPPAALSDTEMRDLSCLSLPLDSSHLLSSIAILSLKLQPVSPPPLPSVTLRALLFWAGCHRDLHVSIMICAVVTTRCSAAH